MPILNLHGLARLYIQFIQIYVKPSTSLPLNILPAACCKTLVPTNDPAETSLLSTHRRQRLAHRHSTCSRQGNRRKGRHLISPSPTTSGTSVGLKYTNHSLPGEFQEDRKVEQQPCLSLFPSKTAVQTEGQTEAAPPIETTTTGKRRLHARTEIISVVETAAIPSAVHTDSGAHHHRQDREGPLAFASQSRCMLPDSCIYVRKSIGRALIVECFTHMHDIDGQPVTGPSVLPGLLKPTS